MANVWIVEGMEIITDMRLDRGNRFDVVGTGGNILPVLTMGRIWHVKRL